MGGFLGIGNSSAKTDRGNQLSATQGDWNIFNYGLPAGQQQQATGSTTLNTSLQTLQPSQDYFTKLLTRGRTQTAADSAPATNAVLAQSDATRNAEAVGGTGRTGGTVALNREAGSSATSKIDNIINENLVTGRQAGAKGLQEVAAEQSSVGSTQLSNALSLLGLGSDAVNSILNNATQSREISNKMNLQTQEQWGQLVGQILLGAGV